jgi:hypothetical protein
VICPIEAFHASLRAVLPPNSTFTPPEGDSFHSQLHAWTLTPTGSKFAKYLGFEPLTKKLKASGGVCGFILLIDSFIRLLDWLIDLIDYLILWCIDAWIWFDLIWFDLIWFD